MQVVTVAVARGEVAEGLFVVVGSAADVSDVMRIHEARIAPATIIETVQKETRRSFIEHPKRATGVLARCLLGTTQPHRQLLGNVEGPCDRRPTYNSAIASHATGRDWLKLMVRLFFGQHALSYASPIPQSITSICACSGS